MKVALDLYNGFHFMDEVIARAITQPLIEANEEVSFANSIKSVLMNKRKMPTGRELTSKVKIHKSDFNLTRSVNGKDGGRDISTYKYKTVQEHEKELHDFLVENHPDEFGPIETEEVVRELPEEEFIRLTEKMFPKWAKQDTKIARFMHNLDPTKVYTTSEFGIFAKDIGITHTGQLFNVNVGTNGFGTIIKQVDGGYQLYPELLSAFKKYF